MRKFVLRFLSVGYLFLPFAAGILWWIFRPWSEKNLVFLFFQLLLFWGFLLFKDLKISALFGLFASLIGVGILALSAGKIKWIILGEIISLWAIIGFFSAFQKIFAEKKRKKEDYFFQLEEELKGVELDNLNKNKQVKSQEEKISHYRNLSSAARLLSSNIELKSIRPLLINLVQEFTGKKTVRIEPFSGQEFNRDPFEAWVYQKQCPLLVRDLTGDLRFDPGQCPLGVESLIIVPVFQSKKIIGLIRLEDPRSKAFQEEDLRLLAILSDLVSLAMDNARLFNQVKELAIKDHLTGVYTQKIFLERLQEEMLRAGRFRLPLFLILLDVDYFKKYNDTYGHQAGDEVLRRVVGIISSLVEETSFVARYGGEEFVILLPQTNRENTFRLAEGIRQKIAAEKFVFSNTIAKLTVSLGIAGFPEDATIPSQLIRIADEYLYQAKSGGRNQVKGRG